MAPKKTQVPSSRAWNDLEPPLSEWLIDALISMGLVRMTPVQASTIPLFMGNKDVVVEAVTGSGKTLAFLLPTIQRLLRLEEATKKHHIAAIIISPTRELASQIYSVLVSLLAFHGPSAPYLPELDCTTSNHNDHQSPSPSTLKIVPQLLLGGTTTPAQDLSTFLKTSPNVLVATPGRLLELLSSPHVHCPQSSFEVLVMDEADRLLDLGFQDDLRKIIQHLPKQRRTGLFSASVTEAVDQIIRVGLRNPVRVVVKVKSEDGSSEKRTPASLQMCYIVTPAAQKLLTTVKLITSVDPSPFRSIIYLSTCAAVDYFQHIFPMLLPDFAVVPLHGKHQPNVRQKNFAKFVNSTVPTVLVTTDVAARGLDIPSVDLVVQIDPPSDPKVFIHRCGRAGRAGRKGLAVTLISPGREEDYVPFLAVRKTPIEPLKNPFIAISESETAARTSAIRSFLLQDRALHDLAQRAFVSWVRAYSKHTASSIFRIADLDWNGLANGWALLRLPRMPELRSWEGRRDLDLNVDFDNYKYKDKIREAHRQKELGSRQKRTAQNDPPLNQSRLVGDKGTNAWSQKKDQKAIRDTRRAKKHLRREMDRQAKMTSREREQEKEIEVLLEKAKEQTQLQEKRGLDEDVFEGFGD